MASNSGGNKRGRRQRSMADAKNGNEKKKGKGGRLSPSIDKDKLSVPLFLQKTYTMIDTCDPAIASWSDDGEMFVVKDSSVFAKDVIPLYFDHNKFSSFARQLNFYGFRKMQVRPIRNDDYDKETSKHITFHNELFKRGRQDLLCRIQRSTKGGTSAANQEQQQDIHHLKEKVEFLENKIFQLHSMMNEMEENHQRQWEAFMNQFQYSYLPQSTGSGSNEQMNQPSQGQGSDTINSNLNVGTHAGYQDLTPSDTHGRRKHEYPNNANVPYTNSDNESSSTHGVREPDFSNNPNTSYISAQGAPRREKSKVTISEEVDEIKSRQPTLKPHPNSKTLPDNIFLPPPPGRSEPAFRGPSRGMSFLRGLSKDYTDIGLFDSERSDEQVNIPPPSNSQIDEMQQPDLSSFQQRYLNSMMSETDIVTSSKPSDVPSNSVGTDMPPPEPATRPSEQVSIPTSTNSQMNEMHPNELTSFQSRYFQSMMREDFVQSSKPSNPRSEPVTYPPESTSQYGETIAKHAAKNMETLQNLNLNCNRMGTPEIKRVPTVSEALPPI